MQNKYMTFILVILVFILVVQGFLLYRVNERMNQFDQPFKFFDKPPDLPQFGSPDQDKWNPYDEFQRMQKEMDQLFSDSFSRFHMNTPFGSFSRSPDLDLQDKGDYFLITLNVPGADESTLNVKVENQILSISVKTERGEDDNQKTYQQRERFVGEFQRLLTLPSKVEGTKLQTELKSGVLTLKIPKVK